MLVGFQPCLEKSVIRIADYIFQEILLLHFDEADFKLVFSGEFQILVDSLQPEVDCLRTEILHQIALVCHQVLSVQLLVVGKEIICRPQIGRYGVPGKIRPAEIIFELSQHSYLIKYRTIYVRLFFLIFAKCIKKQFWTHEKYQEFLHYSAY